MRITTVAAALLLALVIISMLLPKCSPTSFSVILLILVKIGGDDAQMVFTCVLLSPAVLVSEQASIAIRGDGGRLANGWVC